MGKSLPPPPMWIYLNTQIQFVTSHLNHLVFAAILPVLCDDFYQFYTIKAFPIYWNEYVNVTKRIQVEERLAVNNAKSEYFAGDESLCAGKAQHANYF